MVNLRVAVVLSFCFGTLADAQQGSGDRIRVRELAVPQTLTQPVPRAAIGRVDLPGSHASAEGTRPAVLLTGYWPPTNEMLRRFSDDPVKNPDGWIGADWEGRGYDVYAFFPEFVPPNCGICGKGFGDLEVDYQDTSADFWPIADSLDPIAVITFSRGNIDDSWEIEMNQFNKTVWIGDFLAPAQPTPTPPDASVPAETLRPSTLPVEAILAATEKLSWLTPFICFTGDGGGFLSEFMAYHGVWYQDIHADPGLADWCVAAGHVHVGGTLSTPRARAGAHATLRVVLDHVDAVVGVPVCQDDLGFDGPGDVVVSLCGEELATGGLADFTLSGAPAFASTFLATGLVDAPTPFKGGTLVPFPPQVVITTSTDAGGGLTISGVAGGGGPATVYLQAIVVDAAQVKGFAISNALAIELLP